LKNAQHIAQKYATFSKWENLQAFVIITISIRYNKKYFFGTLFGFIRAFNILKMVFCYYRLKLNRSNTHEITSLLQSVAGRISYNPDCERVDIGLSKLRQEELFYVEEWKTFDSFVNHVNSPVFRNVLEAVELSNPAPDVRFSVDQFNKGMEWLEELSINNINQKNQTHPA